jgi:hypothetical protein
MKRLITGAVILVILGLVAFYMSTNQNGSTIRSELSNFAVEDTAAVMRIVMKDQSGRTVDLKRQPDQSWTVNEAYQARPDGIKILLSTMKKLAVKSPVSENNMNSILKGIIASHVLVDVYGEANEPIKSFYVGGANQLHTGTNMMMKGSTRPFVIHLEGFHGFITPRFFTNELEWRSREVFGAKIEEIASLEVTFTEHPEKNFHFENHGEGNLVMLGGEKMDQPARFDTLELNAYLTNYKMIHYESYEETKSKAFLDSIKLSEPLFTITLETDYETKSVIGFRKPLKDGYDLEGNPINYDQDRLYIWVDSNQIFIGQYAIFDKLTKAVYFFR